MRGAASLALVLALGMTPGARAQDDDWGITRDDGGPSDRGRRRGHGRERGAARASEDPPSTGDGALRERYLRIVLSDPRDGFAMDRLLSLYRARDGSLDGLRTEMSARLEASPGERAASLVLSRIAREGGDLDEARRTLSEIAGEAPDPLVERARAAIELAAGDRLAARPHLEAALAASEESDRDEVARALADVLFELEAWDAVEALYDEIASGSRGTYLRTELARELQTRGEHERAIAALDRVAASLSGDRRALGPLLVLRARSEIALGLTDAAIATLERARGTTTASSGVRGEIAELELEAYRSADRLADLVAELGRPSSFGERMILGRALDELGRDEEAAEAYGRAAALAPRDPEPRTRRMRVLLRAGRIDEAIGVGAGLVRAFPDDPRYLTELAELASSAGRRSEALEILETAGRRSPREVALHRALAEIYARWEEPERAEAELERLCELEPDDPIHAVALGDHRLGAGDRAGALAAFRDVLEAAGGGADAHALLGGVYADHDMLPEAVSELEEATRLDPTSLEHARELARVLERADEDAPAEAAWSRTLELAADDPLAAREAREHLVALWSRGHAAGSHLSELRRRFEAATPDVEAGRFLAEILRRRSDEEGAITVLERVVSLAPADVGSWSMLERLRAQEGDRAGAIEALRALAEADADRAASYYLRMSEHASALYLDEDALAYARRATELAPASAAGFARLAALARAGGDLETARTALRRAHEIDERDDDVALALADLEGEAGETARALEILRGVVETSADDESIARAVRAAGGLGAAAEAPMRDALLGAALDEPGRVAVRRLVVDAWSRATASLRAAVLADRASPEERAELTRLVTRALGPVLGALGGDDADRREALSLLGPASVPAAVPALLALAAGTAPLDVRHEALLGAGRAARPEHAPSFAELASDERDLAIRLAALWSLGRLGRTDELLPHLESREASVRALSALGLGRSGAALSGRARDAVATALETSLRDEPQPQVEACLAWALAAVAPHRAAPFLAAPDRLSSPDASVRELTAAALAGAADPVARGAVARHLALGREPAALLVALRRSGADPLAATLRRGESPIALALRSLGLAPLAPLDLSPLASELEAAIRRALEGTEEEAGLALALFEARAGVWTLGPARTASDAETPRLVPSSLALDLAPALAPWAEHGTGEVRARALSLLSSSGAADAEPILTAALGAGSPALARIVLEAAPIRSPAMIQAVLGALRHDDWGVRAVAAEALAAAPETEVTVALAEAARTDPFAVVRDAAVAALGGRDDAVALEALCAAHETDEEAAVRAHAAEILGDRSCPLRVR